MNGYWSLETAIHLSKEMLHLMPLLQFEFFRLWGLFRIEMRMTCFDLSSVVTQNVTMYNVAPYPVLYQIFDFK